MNDIGRAIYPDLAGRRVWVTGAGRGIGRAIAEGFAADGAKVVVTSRTEADLKELAEVQRSLGREILVLPASVSEPAEVAAVAEAIRREWGGLDVLVNAAGVSPTFKKAEEVSDDEWRLVVDVNLTGSFTTARAAALLMLGAGGGSIINFSSIHGRVGMARLAAYSASKGGIDALTRTLALEWATEGIRVNSVSPGYIETEMTEGLLGSDHYRNQLLARVPLGRFGHPDEVIGATLFLASRSSAYITGTAITVDGGWTAA